MSEALGEIAMICQEQQAFTLGIETSDVKEPWEFWRQQIENRISRARVVSGGHEAGRFVERDRQCPLGMNKFAVDFDVITLVGLGAKIGADLSVDRDTPGRDHVVTLAPRSNPGGGQITIQPHG